MGLDTVELVVNIEKHFGLEIPDPVCEQLSTVGDVAKWLGQQLGIANLRHSSVREKVAVQLQQLFSSRSVGEETQLLELIKDHESQLTYHRLFAETSGLKLPTLDVPKVEPPSSWLSRLFDTKLFASGINPLNRTVADLIDWTVALNYKHLLLPPFQSQYDVEQAVIGITSDSSGVEVSDVMLRSSFTNDLGLD
ncbi:phosphopantetheine-binding protein [Hymenobacter sp. DH14]|uniref:Phosphopantetheine-binding protein n=1 Tax=Hymenobacter cyanobacteriorum TaxID=2926463 RepID=A0A9X1VN68_9BACT|nr:phosphopantetheine-binding protein [Hymenobacter cyanobacteriorum]MCI1190190.1 phosphopantetheine-binding protein [Hymenobacter cyanobacteriorum]